VALLLCVKIPSFFIVFAAIASKKKRKEKRVMEAIYLHRIAK